MKHFLIALVTFLLLPLLIINVMSLTANPNNAFVGLSYMFNQAKSFKGFTAMESFIAYCQEWYNAFPTSINSFQDVLFVLVNLYKVCWIPIRLVLALIQQITELVIWIVSIFVNIPTV